MLAALFFLARRQEQQHGDHARMQAQRRSTQRARARASRASVLVRTCCRVRAHVHTPRRVHDLSIAPTSPRPHH
eukprot:6190280-Pleurochrysis_carterae.AAC.1